MENEIPIENADNALISNWIWLDSKEYPDYQFSFQTKFCDNTDYQFAIIQFKKEYDIKNGLAEIRVSGDCRYRLFANEEFVGMGPTFSGGDWARNKDMPQRYLDCYHFHYTGNRLVLIAEVQLLPTLLCDMSSGHGGLYMEGSITDEDGNVSAICTDESWACRVLQEWKNDVLFNNTLSSKAWHASSIVKRKKPELSDIPSMSHKMISTDINGETDKIYTGIIFCRIETDELCEIKLTPYETEDLEDEAETIITSCNLSYYGFRIRSLGGIKVQIISGKAVIKDLSIISMSYPVTYRGKCITDDDNINSILSVSEHTLEICRQSIHIDSPRHMEPLGCTGDYYIESLMEYYTYDDFKLIRFDIIRTAHLIEDTSGIMFHTSYSLLWIMMTYEYILHTGDFSVLDEIRNSISVLLERFHSYENQDGIIDKAPNYMFVDWVEIGGFSMHHPPKALGQTILNALYFRALKTAAELLSSPIYNERANKLKKNFNDYFWDDARQIFISGLTDKTETNEWLPENPNHVFYTLHANIMVVACGICEGERGKKIVHSVLNDNTMTDYQPFFAQFVFEALWKTNLFEEYGLNILRRWIPMIKECSKGLSEGWTKPCDDYIFDHSHAWGGCPRYWVPKAILGLEIKKPGFKLIRIKPLNNFLNSAKIEFMTPYGEIKCTVSKGTIQTLSIPDEIECILE